MRMLDEVANDQHVKKPFARSNFHSRIRCKPILKGLCPREWLIYFQIASQVDAPSIREPSLNELFERFVTSEYHRSHMRVMRDAWQCCQLFDKDIKVSIWLIIADPFKPRSDLFDRCRSSQLYQSADTALADHQRMFVLILRESTQKTMPHGLKTAVKQ